MAIPTCDPKVGPQEQPARAGDLSKTDSLPGDIHGPPKTARFAVVWAGSAISTVATRTLGVAYPLLALAQTKSPTAAGWAGFALTIPILVFYIPGGLLVDRTSCRSVMLCAELCRWLTVMSVLITMFFGGPSLWHLIMAAFLEGTFWVLCNLAETALFPSLVKPVMMRRALAKSEWASHLASLAGRPLGGYLFGVGAWIPFFLNALLFIVSLVLFWKVSPDSGRRPANSLLLSDLSVGFHELMKQDFLRGAILLVTITNLMVNTLIMIFVAGSDGVASLTIGLVLAAGGVGGALGATVAYFWRPPRRILRMHTWIWVGAMLLAALGSVLRSQPVFFALALFATGFGGAMSNVAIRAVEVARIAPETLARVVGVSRLSSYGALSLAAPLGALLVTWHGVAGGSILLFGTMLALALAITFVPRLRTWLTPPLPDLSGDSRILQTI